MKKKLLGINELKAYLNSRTFPEEAIICVFDVEDGTRCDVFNSLDYLEDDLILDINIEGGL